MSLPEGTFANMLLIHEIKLKFSEIYWYAKYFKKA